MAPKRSGKFYRQNEREVMKQLGVKPTKNSGSGWIEKEDGIGEKTIVQLKSTDAQQITVKQKDIRILEQHASESHKAPVFAIQFLNTGEVWLMAKQEDLETVASEIGRNSPICPTEPVFGDLSGVLSSVSQFTDGSAETLPEAKYEATEGNTNTIRTSESGREEFYKEYGRKKGI